MGEVHLSLLIFISISVYKEIYPSNLLWIAGLIIECGWAL